MSIRAAGLVLGFVFVFAGADALATRHQQQGRAQRQRQQGSSFVVKPMFRQNNTAMLRDAGHLKKVEARRRLLSKYTLEGEPGPKGDVFFSAAFAELMPVPGIQQRELIALSYGDNGSHANDRSQRIEVSGLAADGVWRGHLIGTTSAHDLTHLDWGPMEKAIKARIAGDLIDVSYDYGKGTARKTLVKAVKSQAATSIPIEVPLNPNGMTRVIYDRYDPKGTSGRSDAYVGRIVEIVKK